MVNNGHWPAEIVPLQPVPPVDRRTSPGCRQTQRRAVRKPTEFFRREDWSASLATSPPMWGGDPAGAEPSAKYKVFPPFSGPFFRPFPVRGSFYGPGGLLGRFVAGIVPPTGIFVRLTLVVVHAGRRTLRARRRVRGRVIRPTGSGGLASDQTEEAGRQHGHPSKATGFHVPKVGEPPGISRGSRRPRVSSPLTWPGEERSQPANPTTSTRPVPRRVQSAKFDLLLPASLYKPLSASRTCSLRPSSVT